MKTRTKKIKLSLALLLFAIFALTPAANAAQIWTNQEDYGPDEVVYITGTGFDINSVITVTIVGPAEWGADQFDSLNFPWWVYWSFTEPDRFDIGYLKTKCYGTFTVTVTDGTNTAITTFTDASGYLTFYQGYTQTLNIGDVSAEIKVQRIKKASGGNPEAPDTSGNLTVNLATTSSGGHFYSDALGTTLITSVSISNGVSISPGFYYKDTTVGTPTLTASGASEDSGATVFTITSGEPSDTTPPIVSSIVRADTNPTNAASVDFTVTFSESVTGVDTTDFDLTTTGGISGASVTGVSGSDSIYTVTVSTGTGDGTIRLDVIDDDTIVDLAGNELGGTGTGNGDFTTGEVYTIDKTEPTVTIDIPDYINIANVASVPVAINSDEDGDYEYDISDSLTHITDSDNILDGVTVNLNLDLSSLADGPVTADASVEDAVGNIGYAPQDTSFKDTVAPTLTKDLVGTEGNNGWYTSNVTVTLNGDDPDDPVGSGSGLDKVEYNLNDGGWTTYTGPFDITSEGTNTLEHRAYDNAGNSYVLPSQEIKIDKTAPVVTITTPQDGSYVNSLATISGTINEDNCLTSAGVKIQRASDGKYWNGSDWQSSEVWLDATVGGSAPDFSFSYDASGITDVDAYTITARATDCAGNMGTSSSVTCIILPESVITAGGCMFDKDGSEGTQFRLIFTPDITNLSAYKLNASNPGQFFYNIFYVGTPGEIADISIDVPYPFVTQGAMPVHVYANVSFDGECFIPEDEIGVLPAQTNNNPDFNLLVEVPETGLVYVRIHLDYGLKKTYGYTKDGSNNAIDSVTIYDLTEYDFIVSGDVEDTQTIQNVNVFKHDPGFAGIVTDSEDNPIGDVTVEIYNPDGSLLTSVTTDEDGFYFFYYKHKGKAADYTITLPDYSLSQSVTVKANGLVQVDFVVP